MKDKKAPYHSEERSDEESDRALVQILRLAHNDKEAHFRDDGTKNMKRVTTMDRGLTGKRGIVLRDGGFTIMMLLLFAGRGIGLAVGFLLDGLWNYLVLNFTLNRVLDLSSAQFPRPKKILYVFVVTLVGFVIDFIYDMGVFRVAYGLSRRPATSSSISAAMGTALEVACFLAAMIAVGLVNLGAGRWYLRIQRQNALKFAASMGFLTAPWLLFFFWTILGLVSLLRR